MHPRMTELTDHLAACRAELWRAVESVPEGRRGIPPAPDRWSVAQVLEHLSRVEARITTLVADQVAAGRAEGLGAETETSPILPTMDMTRLTDRSRPIEASPYSRPSESPHWEAAWRALEDARKRLLATIAEADGLALGTLIVPHPVLGELDLYRWIGFVGAHELRHADQIRDVGAALDPERRGRGAAGPIEEPPSQFTGP